MLFRKFVIFLLITLFLLGLPVSRVEADKVVVKPSLDSTIQVRRLDPRAEILNNYLSEKGSPLAVHAGDFIEAADIYGLDWKLIPAISGVESTFGKAIPGGYNGWGWGVYGNQALGFKSWRDGIFTVSKGLKEGYVDKGLKDPYSMNKVYASSPAWGGHVDYFLKDIDRYARINGVSEFGSNVITRAMVEPLVSDHSARLSSDI